MATKSSNPHLEADGKAESRPWRLLLCAALVGLAFGRLDIGEPGEDVLRTARNAMHPDKASGDIVLVKIDNESVRKIGRWPWPRRYHAKLIDQLTRAGAKRIFFDIQFYAATDPSEDRALAEAIKRSGRVVLSYGTSLNPNGALIDQPPLPMFTRGAKVAATGARYNYQNAAWRLDYAVSDKAGQVPSFAALMAGATGGRSSFLVDYSIDPESIPAVSAASVLNGSIDSRRIRGKDVAIGSTSNFVGDIYFIPGHRQMGGVYVNIIGAETLKRGRPLDFGWVPGLILALAGAALALRSRKTLQQTAILAVPATLLLFGIAALEARQINMEVMPGVAVLMLVGAAITRRRYRLRGLVNAISSLPNLNALRANTASRDKALVAARIHNYADVAATLPTSSEQELVEQIVARLCVGAKSRTVYQGDGGIFAWFEDPRAPFGNHLEALYALFRNPVKVGGYALDLTVSFGVEIGSGRSIANRLGSALVAAEEAAHDGLKWKYHDPESLQDASWRLSMLSQLDEAIDQGQVWVAFQPQTDLRTGRIIGAEALARWTHPEKGPIAASEFIAAAEQHDRIGKLTDFVMEKAISSASTINRRGVPFQIAVNLSAKLLTDKQFAMRVGAMLARHGLPAERLTLELTETIELADCGVSLDALMRLRDLGIRISIDDYGTGLSTLDYLKKIPAHEIKIDQSFVKTMIENRSDRLMVQSTIGLAHSLGRKVVAEGIENRETLALLTDMECDIGQGFAIGRPMSLESLVRRLPTSRGRQVA